MTTSVMKQFLAKSEEFCNAMFREIKKIPCTDETEPRISATLIMADISSEHHSAILTLARNGNFISSTSLLRLQYEALLRAYWLYWYAKDERVDALHQPISEQNVKKIENWMPNITEMLADLNKAVDAEKLPNKAVQLFQEFRERHIKPTNSFIHGGMHAFNRQRDGYIEPMLIQIVQNSNGIQTLNAMLQGAMCDGSGLSLFPIVQMQYLYMDCLPMDLDKIIQKFYSKEVTSL